MRYLEGTPSSPLCPVGFETATDKLAYAVWARHNNTLVPWVEDPLFMYQCTDYCPWDSPTPLPSPAHLDDDGAVPPATPAPSPSAPP